MSDFWNSKTVRARKEHRCDECNGTIPAGGQYIRESGKMEGSMYTIAFCELCRAMWAKAGKIFGWYGEDAPPMGDLRYALKDEGIADPETWTRAAITKALPTNTTEEA